MKIMHTYPETIVSRLEPNGLQPVFVIFSSFILFFCYDEIYRKKNGK